MVSLLSNNNSNFAFQQKFEKTLQESKLQLITFLNSIKSRRKIVSSLKVFSKVKPFQIGLLKLGLNLVFGKGRRAG